jgi:transposase InsO family protein
MPWRKETVVSQRMEFMELVMAEGSNLSELCRRFGISRKSAYKWRGRLGSGDPDWARDRSRRPHRSPGRTAAELEQTVLELRDAHPAWGGRKLRRLLRMRGVEDPPSVSTLTEVLRRHGRILPEESQKRGPMERFERDDPNDLWQMDFKGAVKCGAGPCHPLTVVDDHSRFAVCVAACGDEREETVKPRLIESFRAYGLPERMLMDNGSAWGAANSSRYTKLGAWLLRLDIGISHGRPYHPQTQGKNERFNRTLLDEAIRGRVCPGLDDWQKEFDRFREVYNFYRPHEALGQFPPATRYRPSRRPFPEKLPPVAYEQGEVTRQVGPAGYVGFAGDRYQVGRAFTGHRVALRGTDEDGVLEVYFCKKRVARIDLRAKSLEQT